MSDVYSSRFYCPFCETWSVHIEEHFILQHKADEILYWRAHCVNCYAMGPGEDVFTVSPQVAVDTWIKIVPPDIEIPKSITGILYGELPKE